jgi:CheY-like chemotaxis protein
MNKLGFVPGGVDVVIIDIGLPDRGGDALFTEIRAIYPSLPIVLATGQSASDLRDRFKGATRMALVTKPYTADNLLNALRQVGITSSPAANGR